jgi:acetyltransferase-like isoleucine patch superfamily enzyme
MVQHFVENDWFSHPLPSNVLVGAGSYIYSSFGFLHCNSQMPAGVRIGRHSGVYNGTFFDIGPHAEIVIGDYCALVGVIFSTDGKVSVGDYTFFAHEVVVADSDYSVPGSAVRLNSNWAARALHCCMSLRIGSNVWIGAQSALIGSIEIGDGAIIGAGAVIREDVPPYTIWAGNPARQIRALKKW